MRQVKTATSRRAKNDLQLSSAQNPLDTFPRNFPVDREVVGNKKQVIVVEFGKWHDTTDFCPCQLVTDLSFMLQTCCGLASLVVLGTGTGTWSVLKYNFRVLVLVLVLACQVLVLEPHVLCTIHFKFFTITTITIYWYWYWLVEYLIQDWDLLRGSCQLVNGLAKGKLV